MLDDDIEPGQTLMPGVHVIDLDSGIDTVLLREGVVGVEVGEGRGVADEKPEATAAEMTADRT